MGAGDLGEVPGEGLRAAVAACVLEKDSRGIEGAAETLRRLSAPPFPGLPVPSGRPPQGRPVSPDDRLRAVDATAVFALEKEITHRVEYTAAGYVCLRPPLNRSPPAGRVGRNPAAHTKLNV